MGGAESLLKLCPISCQVGQQGLNTGAYGLSFQTPTWPPYMATNSGITLRKGWARWEKCIKKTVWKRLNNPSKLSLYGETTEDLISVWGSCDHLFGVYRIRSTNSTKIMHTYTCRLAREGRRRDSTDRTLSRGVVIPFKRNLKNRGSLSLAKQKN